MRRMIRALTAMTALGVLALALGPSPLPRFKPKPAASAAPASPGLLVVDLEDDATDADLAAIEGLLGADFDWASDVSQDDGLILGYVPDLQAAVAALAGRPGVEAAEPDLVMTAFPLPEAGTAGADASPAGADVSPAASLLGSGDAPNDPLYPKQWHLRAMGAPAGWAATPRGEGIVVAVIDTGVTKVEDLEGTSVLAGRSFVPGTGSAADDNGHGTHCAGTVAQTTNNGKGVAGVAPAATILPVKVLSGGGSGSSAWIASGIDWAVDQGADVISLSLGGGYSTVIHTAVQKATAKGVIVVAAAGNSGREGVSYPGGLDETIGVSATGPDGGLAPYSSWGKGVDIAAPGGDKRVAGGGVWQDTVDGKGGHHYAEFQGTSMATPHVAGAAAVLLSTGMAPEQVETALLGTAKGDGGWDPKLGYGRLDLIAALHKVTDRYGALRAGMAILFSLIATQAAGVRPGFRAAGAGLAAFFAGGLFFLDSLPLPGGALLDILARPLLLWPAALGISPWVNFPLWLSALLPALAAFVLGAFRPTRPVALGLACGIGAHLIHGAATGTLNPWWLPPGLDALWLLGNGALCMVFGLALAGAEKLDDAA